MNVVDQEYCTAESSFVQDQQQMILHFRRIILEDDRDQSRDEMLNYILEA
jgi:hypothetical protein